LLEGWRAIFSCPAALSMREESSIGICPAHSIEITALLGTRLFIELRPLFLPEAVQDSNRRSSPLSLAMRLSRLLAIFFRRTVSSRRPAFHFGTNVRKTCSPASSFCHYSLKPFFVSGFFPTPRGIESSAFSALPSLGLIFFFLIIAAAKPGVTCRIFWQASLLDAAELFWRGRRLLTGLPHTLQQGIMRYGLGIICVRRFYSTTSRSQTFHPGPFQRPVISM